MSAKRATLSWFNMDKELFIEAAKIAALYYDWSRGPTFSHTHPYFDAIDQNKEAFITFNHIWLCDASIHYPEAASLLMSEAYS